MASPVQTQLNLSLAETKKHSGKYVVTGTESDVYPVYLYLRRDWMGGKIPNKVVLTVAVVD